MVHEIISPKKLIEVALPLDKINAASAATKRKAPKGYPTTIHNWWAQRPVAAARAVIFGQLVNDPEDFWRCQNPGKEPNPQIKGHWTKSRARLFQIIEDLVEWENTNNERVLNSARAAILESWRQTCELNKNHPDVLKLFDPDRMPGLHDPFAGGGAIPLEAQRLGLQSFASDLNPVAVLINKALIEVPRKFSDKPPVHPLGRNSMLTWQGNAGLADDLVRYGRLMRDEAENRIGAFYPSFEITEKIASDRPDLKQYIGQKLKVVAWIWARTVRSPNPAFAHVDVPLASTFILSSKIGKESFVRPIIGNGNYIFEVRVGSIDADSKTGTTFGRQKGFRCLMSGVPIGYEYIREQALAGRMGQKLMSIVAEGSRGRVHLSPDDFQELTAKRAVPPWRPSLALPEQALGFRVQLYGMKTYGDIFTDRQLLALTTLSDLVAEMIEIIRADAIEAGMKDDDVPLDSGGTGARAYAQTVGLYLAFGISRVSDYGSTISTWRSKDNAMRSTFSKQAIPMTWDFAEGSPFSKSSSGLLEAISVVASTLNYLPKIGDGIAKQSAAQDQIISNLKFVSTDPPYYDNIGYSDLSDYFYVWLRGPLKPIFPSLFDTIAVPKAEELVATPYRHGNADNAEKFFLAGMTQAMANIASQSHPGAPVSIYYAFKQSETETSNGTSSSGWETFLEAVLKAGLSITGTWPMRTEGDNRQIGQGANALASSIVLVCRPRQHGAGSISRRQFARLLNQTLPPALDAMTRQSEGLHSPVAPADLSQAIIGPGMAIFSRYDSVIEADGSPMTVKTALQLINRFLAEDDFDADTQFCLHWFEQHGWSEGPFGEADQLARAKGTAVNGVQHAGVVRAAGGRVSLLRPTEYSPSWNPVTDERIPVWEALHQLIRLLRKGGYSAAGDALSSISSKADAARQLAYRLYTLCERKGWSDDAHSYNEFITSWTAIEDAASRSPKPRQANLFDA